MTILRHSWSDSDRETATPPPLADPAAGATPPPVERAASRRPLLVVWASTALLGAAGLAASYLHRHQIGGQWGGAQAALGAGTVQFVFALAWQRFTEHGAEVTAPHEGAARRPRPHPRGPAER